MANGWPPLATLERRSGRALSSAEWLSLPEDEPGELVAGELEEEETPDAVHELAVAWLIRTLGLWLGPRGFVFGSELKLLTGVATGRKPDVTVYLPGGRVPNRRGAVTVPPDIAIEVVTPTPRDERRDRVEKMAEYAAFGVRYYWIVDPALGALEVFESDSAGNYTKVAGQTTGVIDPVPGCPGLVLELDALWRDLARLAED
jgi:Uma2 family endonuclease